VRGADVVDDLGMWSMISAKLRSAVLMVAAAGLAAETTSLGTSEPAYSTSGHSRIKRWPLTVISSGSPGPAPMK